MSKPISTCRGALAGLDARHILEMSDARDMGKALEYDLARRAYRLD